MLILQQMCILFIFMALGFIAGKLNKITDEASKALSWIVVNIANPALILSAGVSGDNTVKGRELLYVSGLAIAVFAALIIISFIIPVILRIPADSKGVFRAMTIFSNIGFMGFPVISAVYGSSGLLYASIFLFLYNILIYTIGISFMKNDKSTKEKIKLGKIFNIGVIACILSLVLYLLNVETPEFIKDTISYLSGLTAPLSMMVIGESMIHIKVRDMLSDFRLIIFSLIKLILIPAIGMFIIGLFISNPLIKGVCLVMLATPVGSMTAMLAQQYGGNYPQASKGVALTTILSVATMPLLFAAL